MRLTVVKPVIYDSLAGENCVILVTNETSCFVVGW